MLTAVRVMAAQVIIRLRHEGSTTWVQCQFGFVGDPCSYQEDTF